MALENRCGALVLSLSWALLALGCEDEHTQSSTASAGGGPFDSGGSNAAGGSGAGGSGGAAGGSVLPDVPELEFASVVLPGATNSTDFAFVPGKSDEFLVTAQAGILFHYRFTSTDVAELGRATIPDTFYFDAAVC